MPEKTIEGSHEMFLRDQIMANARTLYWNLEPLELNTLSQPTGLGPDHYHKKWYTAFLASRRLVKLEATSPSCSFFHEKDSLCYTLNCSKGSRAAALEALLAFTEERLNFAFKNTGPFKGPPPYAASSDQSDMRVKENPQCPTQ